MQLCMSKIHWPVRATFTYSALLLQQRLLCTVCVCVCVCCSQPALSTLTDAAASYSKHKDFINRASSFSSSLWCSRNVTILISPPPLCVLFVSCSSQVEWFEIFSSEIAVCHGRHITGQTEGLDLQLRPTSSHFLVYSGAVCTPDRQTDRQLCAVSHMTFK